MTASHPERHIIGEIGPARLPTLRIPGPKEDTKRSLREAAYLNAPHLIDGIGNLDHLAGAVQYPEV